MVKLFRYFRRKSKAHHVDAYSAQAAFFLLFSSVPLLLLLFSSVKIFAVSEDAFAEFMTGILPSFLHPWITEIMHNVFRIGSMGTTWISALAVVWSASKCVYCIIGGLNSIFELKEHRSFWAVRMVSILYTLLMIIAFLFTMLLMAFGAHLAEKASEWFSAPESHLSVLVSARFSIGLPLLTLFFAYLYKGLPAAKNSMTDMLPGAVVSAVGWVSFSSMFAFYIEHFANYANLYGGLTSIIVFMLWVYICMQILFFGAELNLLFRRLRQ